MLRIPGTKLHGFTENAVLEFLNGKQARNPEITKLKLWFEREVFFTLRRKRQGVGDWSYTIKYVVIKMLARALTGALLHRLFLLLGVTLIF